MGGEEGKRERQGKETGSEGERGRVKKKKKKKGETGIITNP